MTNSNRIKIHPYFYLKEFDCRGKGKYECKCDGAVKLNSDFFDKLVIFRRYLGRPMNIIRGFSCHSWNKKVGGAEHSKHLKGKAIDWDVYSIGLTEKEAAAIAIDSGLFTGVGQYGKSYKDYSNGDIVLVPGYKGLKGMVHLEYCSHEAQEENGIVKLQRAWGDLNA